MIMDFKSERAINFNRSGLVYMGEMFNGKKLYRGFGTNLMLSEPNQLSISGDKTDIKIAKEGLYLLGIKLTETEE